MKTYTLEEFEENATEIMKRVSECWATRPGAGAGSIIVTTGDTDDEPTTIHVQSDDQIDVYSAATRAVAEGSM